MHLKRHYEIPIGIKKYLKTVLSNYKGSEKIKGHLFARNCIKNGFITGHQLKKLKSIIDGVSDIQYQLYGGDQMKKWVNTILDQVRDREEKEKKAQTEAGLSNRYRKTHTKGVRVSPLSESLIIFL